MDLGFVAMALAVLGLVAPFALMMYLQRLPVAPACPTCRAVTRAVDRRWIAIQALSLLPTTFVGECGRCGWRGRMRWRWATRTAGRDDR